MSKPNDTISRYLANYAEASSTPQSERLHQQHARAIVIPLFDEDPDCLHAVLQATDNNALLVIAVVNAPQDADPKAWRRTKKLLNELNCPNPATLLIVDCVSEGQCLPPKQGVGLARKIGTDIALQLYANDKLTSPWFYQTDADAELPADYFSTQLDGEGAIVFAHAHHSDDPTIATAAALYDLHMRYYVAGLNTAGSSYAFPTLGSTLVLHAQAYAAVRGYPRRSAAEDFYILNKIAKVAGVTYRDDLTIKLRARISTRVPFGTGPALAKICDILHFERNSENESALVGQTYQSYHPASFDLLSTALRYLDEVANNNATDHPKVTAILETLGFAQISSILVDKYPTAVRRRQILHQWFDAGKTLRFIHQARRYYPDQPLMRTLLQTLQ